ncbi:unnamed protein product [Brachionus calyciflorus]|uniref:Choline transporter-like protein n=1 Tax=Brachionus calyciflorus TaxID=104777 RepID=A0A813M501_9BILA|nr:unnamed protein product [Brachionus calyciflorus]
MGCCGDNDKTPIKPRPNRRRSCTDCLFFLIFVIFVFGMFVITALTVLDEGFTRLKFGYDSYGNICGKRNPIRKGQKDFIGKDLTDKKYVLYFDFLMPRSSLKVCVDRCPNETIYTAKDFETYTSKIGHSLCLYNVSAGQYDPNLCPKLPIFKSDSFLFRCVPSLENLNIVLNKTDQLIENKILNLKDIQFSALELYKKLNDVGYLSIAALIVTIALVILLRYIAKFMVYLVLVLSSVACIAGSVLLWLKYDELMKSNQKDNNYRMPLLEISMKYQTAYLIYSISMTIATVILLLIILVMRKRINLVLGLIAEAQKALGDMPLLLGMPLITFIFLFIFLFYWIMTAIMIYSFGEYEDAEIVISNYSLNKKSLSTFIWWYHIVGLVWISEFIFGCQSMVIASAVSKWYFTKPKSALRMPICTAISRLLFYHLGSVALGSFLIVLVRIPRYILMYFQDKIKASRSTVAEYCSKACICCLWCLEKFIKFINYNAYTIIAIEGKSFCTSAQKAFVIIVENSLRIATINTVGDFILFLAKLAVSAITLFIGIYWFHIPVEDPIKNLHVIKVYFLPLAVVCIIAFLIAHCFFTVYEMVIDAIMVCFCEDCKANDGSDERPYYMSGSLKKLIDESSSTHIMKD